MKKRSSAAIKIACLALSLSSVSSDLKADPPPSGIREILPSRIDPSLLLFTPPTLVRNFTRTVTGSVMKQPTPAFSGGAALASFYFLFGNGDHKIREISVLQSQGQALYTFADQNSDDPYNAAAAWYQSPSFIPEEIIATGGGEFDIQMPNARPGYTPVLRGFSFVRAPNTDANIRIIGVRINPESNSIRVNLQDDESADLRGWETRVGEGLGIIGVPLGAFAGGFHIFDGSHRIGQTPKIDGHRRYDVTVQIAWVPNSMITSRGQMAGSTQFPREGSPSPGRYDKAAIQGFIFNFRDSDHHLMALGVNTSGVSRSADVNSASILYQDNNLDDAKRWVVNYVMLR